MWLLWGQIFVWYLYEAWNKGLGVPSRGRRDSQHEIRGHETTPRKQKNQKKRAVLFRIRDAIKTWLENNGSDKRR